MGDWAAANARLRADRDAMDETKRREAAAPRAAAEDRVPEGCRVVRPVAGDCNCTAGHVCRHNGACPRRASSERGAR